MPIGPRRIIPIVAMSYNPTANGIATARQNHAEIKTPHARGHAAFDRLSSPRGILRSCALTVALFLSSVKLPTQIGHSFLHFFKRSSPLVQALYYLLDCHFLCLRRHNVLTPPSCTVGSSPILSLRRPANRACAPIVHDLSCWTSSLSPSRHAFMIRPMQ